MTNAPCCPAHPAVQMQPFPKQRVPRANSHSQSMFFRHVIREMNQIQRFRCPVPGRICVAVIPENQPRFFLSTQVL
jgi:hypothetical protein